MTREAASIVDAVSRHFTAAILEFTALVPFIIDILFQVLHQQ